MRRSNRREIMGQRSNQDTSGTPVPRGNYRLDAQGQPIIPQYNEADLNRRRMSDQDYFTHPKHSQPQRSAPQRVYHLDQYRQGQRRWQERSRSTAPPSSRQAQRNQGNYYQREAPLAKPSTGRTFSRKDSAPQKHANFQGALQKDIAALPKGKTKLLAVYMALLVISLITAYQVSPLKRINQMTVEGNNYVQDQVVIEATNLLPFDEVDRLYAQKQAVVDKMKLDIPLIESVSFRKDDWQETQIIVNEMEAVAQVERNGQMNLVLANGTMIDSIPQTLNIAEIEDELPNLYQFESQGKVMELANNALRNIEPELLAQMEGIYLTETAENPNAIEVHMKDGNLVQAIINTFAQKMQYYPNMLEQLDGQKGVINLEVGAYFTTDLSGVKTR